MADYYKNGIASALRHIAYQDRVLSHKSKNRTPSWRRGYTDVLNLVEEDYKNETFCNVLLESCSGVYECTYAFAKRVIRQARKAI